MVVAIDDKKTHNIGMGGVVWGWELEGGYNPLKQYLSRAIKHKRKQSMLWETVIFGCWEWRMGAVMGGLMGP